MWVAGEPAGSIAGAGRVDLWQLCDRHAGASLVVRSGNGTFAKGECEQRGEYSFTVGRDGDTESVVLTRRGRARPSAGVRAPIVVDVLRAGPPPIDPGLTIAVAGRPERSVRLGAIVGEARRGVRGGRHADDGHGDENREGKDHDGDPRPGVSIADLLGQAGVRIEDVLELVVIGTERYAIAPEVLASPTETLSLRRNRRGALRFEHVIEDGTRARRISAVVRLDVQLRAGSAAAAAR